MHNIDVYWTSLSHNNTEDMQANQNFIIAPASMKLKGGILVSRRPSVRLSVRLWTELCPPCIFHNTNQIHLIFAILSSNFRICTMYKGYCKILKFEL